jgi:EAL domain-containing protein (putative c-di-GMP-specific phosphodiesterase class I)
MLPDLKDINRISQSIEEIQSALELPLILKGEEHHITCSIGVSVFPRDGGSSEELIRNAVTALHAVDGRPKNVVSFFNASMTSSMAERLQTERALRKAYEAGEFELHYQPQICANTGKLLGAEALVRWNSPERGMVSPATFIPICEESGLIVGLGEWVLRESCRQTKEWLDAGHTDLVIGVNISGIQVRDGGLVDIVRRALDDTGLPAHNLELELTESELMATADGTIEVLQQLKDMGLELSVDDFGTGYSSLAYLKRLPVDIIKVDQAFVRDIGDDPEDEAIVSAIIALGRQLGKRTLAEGVERPEQIKLLRRMGCDVLQGYAISRPTPASAFQFAHSLDPALFQA